MSTGDDVLDWLYSTQLQIDEQWSVRRPGGFTWWPHHNAQTIEIVGEETGPGGERGYLIGIRTEMLSGVELTDAALAELNAGPMRFASMSGPVYDPETGTLSLCSLARVFDDIAAWMQVLLSSAAVLQLAEVDVFSEKLAELLGAQVARSGHPENGLRPQPDEMAFAAQVFVAQGGPPSRWTDQEFEDAVAQYMLRPPSVGASAGGNGMTVEFPYGERSSLCQFLTGQAHPIFGHGLLIVQRFPYPVDELDGIRAALELNRTDLTESVSGYGFGSYVYTDSMICFSGFLPNGLHQPGMLPSFYFAAANRAQSMAERLLGRPWDADSFTLDHSAIGRTATDES